LGRNEVRIAYVLNKHDLNNALTVLEKALEAYPYTTTIHECGAIHSKADL
jgi:aspartate aminotransferase